MKTREFTDALKALVGDLNWGMVMKMEREYKKSFILRCTRNAQGYIKKRTSPLSKTVYLRGICKSDATSNDLKMKGVKIDMTSFKL